MNSMTGYGKCVIEENDRILTVEIKSVNNRFLEISCKLPKVLLFAEDTIKRAVKSRLGRGSVDVSVAYVNNSQSGKTIAVDRALAEAYASAAKETAELTGVPNDLTVSVLMRFPDVITAAERTEDNDLLLGMVERAAAGATEALCTMRAAEGETVRADLMRLVGNIESALERVEVRSPLVTDAYREKLKARITEALSGVELDEARLCNEAAFFADKADINEEISRLHSHIGQFRTALDSAEPQGRNLDFISQEMGREINTMGSKANDTELTNLVVYMKNELEKIKEQIRNAE